MGVLRCGQLEHRRGACDLRLRIVPAARHADRVPPLVRTRVESLSPELKGSLQEMALRAVLGHATMVTAGNSSEVREALERALRLAEELNDPLHQFRLLSGLHFYHRRIGAFDELLPIARQAERIAPLLGGAGPIVAAKAMLAVSHHLKGHLAEAYTALVQVRDAPVDANAMLNFYGFHRDAEVLIARTLWLQGFPDQAAHAEHAANKLGRHKDPVTACLGLMWGISVHYLRGDWATTESYIERILEMANEHSFLPSVVTSLILVKDVSIYWDAVSYTHLTLPTNREV